MSAGTNVKDPVETMLSRIVALRPMPTRSQREFAVRLYRQLSQGKPVRVEELAETMNRRTLRARLREPRTGRRGVVTGHRKNLW